MNQRTVINENGYGVVYTFPGDCGDPQRTRNAVRSMILEGDEQELGRRELPGSSLAPSVARSFIEETLNRYHLDEVLEAALLLTSEAVTNAVTHAHTSSTLSVRIIGDVIRISVTDMGHGRIVVRTAPPQESGGGRGLFIIDQMALRWGTQHTDWGTEIWFDLPQP